MGDHLRHKFTIDTIPDDDNTHNNKDIADHAAGKLNADDHTDHSDELIKVALGTHAVVDHLKVRYPITDCEGA